MTKLVSIAEQSGTANLIGGATVLLMPPPEKASRVVLRISFTGLSPTSPASWDVAITQGDFTERWQATTEPASSVMLVAHDLILYPGGDITVAASNENSADTAVSYATEVLTEELDPGIYPHLRAITANRVIWTWVKNGIDVATVSPTIDIMSREGITLIDGPKAATINPRDVQHRYEAASPIFIPRNQYFLVLSATIDGVEVTQDIPINT